jgi:3-hydroxymyristoyl/3-hydroxydecanoyl-(acyl carrier protein) dehydratase
MLLLPHRHAFLLVDRVVALVRGKYIHGIKNVAITEPFLRICIMLQLAPV